MLLLLITACSEVGFSGRIPEAIDPARGLRIEPPELSWAPACAGEEIVVSPVVFSDGDRPSWLTDVLLPDGWESTVSFPVEIQPGGAVPIHARGPASEGTVELAVQTEGRSLVSSLTMSLDEPPEISFVGSSDGIFGAGTSTVRALIQDDPGPARTLDVLLSSDVDGPVGWTTAQIEDGVGLAEWTWRSESQSAGEHLLRATTADRCGQEAEGFIEICQDEATSDSLSLDEWSLHGSAVYDEEGGYVVLVPLVEFASGSAFDLRRPVVSTDVDIAFRFWIGGGSGADGISLTMLDDGQAASFVGEAGGGMGYAGLPGWSVEVDVWENELDPTPRDHLSFHLDGDQETVLAWALLPEMEDTDWHDMHVTVQGSQVSVSIDGIPYLDLEVPELVPFEGYLGFTAATGGSTHEHRIDSPLLETGACKATKTTTKTVP